LLHTLSADKKIVFTLDILAKGSVKENRHLWHCITMKIDLLLVIDHFSRPCGIRTIYLKLLEWCEKQGISIALISDADHEISYRSIKKHLKIQVNDERKIAQLKRRPLMALIHDDLQIVHMDLNTCGISNNDAIYLDAWNGSRDWLPSLQAKCSAFIDGIEPGRIVIATQSFLGFAVASLLERKKFAICLHTHYAAFYAIRVTGAEDSLFRLIESQISERLRSFFIENASQVFLMTESSSSFFQLGNHQRHFFKPGVDISIFRPHFQPTKRILNGLYVGRWSNDKGTQIFSDLFNRISSVNWTIAGGEASDSKFANNVTLLGFLDFKELANVMATSDFLIFYGKWDTFGLVALEALSCGVPVLAYKGSEIAHLVEVNNCGFSFTSIDELVKIITRLDMDRSLLGNLRNNARGLAENMTWEHSVESFVRTLNL
jgi:glycosyltransferase involved in cell wall biosynthesis